MFSGIVEEAARVAAVTRDKGNVRLTMQAAMTPQLTIDQSVAHNGVCLTVVEVRPDDTYDVVAVSETLERSNLGSLHEGDLVNLERSMRLDGRLDGHIVQGHVDTTAECVAVKDADGSKYFTFRYQVSPEMQRAGYMTVEKGSVTVNGVSLTVCDSQPDGFSVAIIPYTLEHTNFHRLQTGDRVNIEFDILGKYIARLATFK